MRRIFNVTVMMAILALSAFPLMADTYDLNVDHCTGGCGPAGTSFGIVTVTQNGANTVHINVTLNLTNTVGIVNTGLDTFGFNLVNEPNISISNLTAGFSATGAQSAADNHINGFGTFDYHVLCPSACGQGGNSPFAGQLNFDVTSANLTPLSFIQLSEGGSPSVYFSLDIMGKKDSKGKAANNTGVVGAVCQNCGGPNPPQSQVPETSSLILFGTVALGMIVLRRTSKPA